MFEPVGHRVLIEMDKVDLSVDEKTEGGLLIKPMTVIDQETEKKKHEQRTIDKGTVLALGPTVGDIYKCEGENWCPVGSRVAYARQAGVTWEEDGKWFRVVNDEDIYAVER